MVRKGYTRLILCTVSGVAAGLQKHGLIVRLDKSGTIPSEPRNSCVIISKKTSSAPALDGDSIETTSETPFMMNHSL